MILAPGEDWNDDKYVAEVPLFPGCFAWGDSPEQAVEYLQSVAQALIDGARERGWPLPSDVAALSGSAAAGAMPEHIKITGGTP